MLASRKVYLPMITIIMTITFSTEPNVAATVIVVPDSGADLLHFV